MLNYDCEKIIISLLPIFDDLERTISEEYKDSQSIQKGISIIIANIKKILNDNKINQFLSLGEKFNPPINGPLFILLELSGII